MDPIADMLASIKNAQAVLKKKVKIPFSDFKFRIAKILEREGFLGKVAKKGRGPKKFIIITLKYKDKTPLITGLKKVSTPGQPVYVGVKDIELVKSGYGTSIVSTSQGLMTGKEARKKNLGGELICKIW